MKLDKRVVVECTIKELSQQTNYRRAATVAIEGYGSEILAYLTQALNSREQAQDAFQDWALSVFEGLPKFRWDSSFRSWAFKIARNCKSDAQRRAWKIKEDHQGDSFWEKRNIEHITSDSWKKFSNSFLNPLTMPSDHLPPGEYVSPLMKLREKLSDDELDLLILRVGHRMKWQGISEITGEKVNTLNQRYVRIKKKLNELAQKEGLLEDAKKHYFEKHSRKQKREHKKVVN